MIEEGDESLGNRRDLALTGRNPLMNMRTKRKRLWRLGGRSKFSRSLEQIRIEMITAEQEN